MKVEVVKLAVAQNAWILVEGEELVTLEKCMAVKKGSYNSPDGKKMKISPGETILYQYVEDGSITVHPTNTYCQVCPFRYIKAPWQISPLSLPKSDFPCSVKFTSDQEEGKTAAKFSKIALPSDCNRHWSLDGPKVYLMDEQVQSCPYKRIRTASLRPERTSMMISEELAMLFNTTKKEVLMLPGCTQLTLYHTSLGTVYLTFDNRAAGLPEVVIRDLILTLKYLEHKNSRALSDLNNRVERGGCSTWLNIKNDQDYLHPLRSEGAVPCLG